MPFHVATAAASYREATEDRLAIHHLDGGCVVVVADGVGGVSGGGRAADLAVKIIGEAIDHGTFNRFSANPWVELLIHADAIIASDRDAGATTIAVVAVAEDVRVVGASCGDSGAVIVGADGRLDDLTAKQHKRRRLGSGRALPVAFERAALGGKLVVATDGLLSFATPGVIARIAVDDEGLDEAAEALVRAARLPNGALQDDVAVVVVRRE
ncbi:MAG: protein phosphatase 2C domain-containing protein [Myxococcales bacterium]|nr:protein phosphatase 2C domain-containing protein [Myxococcales bacterium]